MNKRAMGLSPLVKGIVMVVVFSLFMISFVFEAIDTKNPNSEIFDEKYGLNNSKNQMKNVISNFTETSNSVFSQLGSSEPTAVDYIFLIFKGAFYIPLAFLSFVFMGITAITAITFPALAGTGLGDIASIAIGVIFSSIIITIVLLIVKAIRTGESER